MSFSPSAASLTNSLARSVCIDRIARALATDFSLIPPPPLLPTPSYSFHRNRGLTTVGQLAEILDQSPVGVIKFLMTDLGVMASMTQTLDYTTCVAVAEGFGKIVGDFDEDEYDEEDEDTALVTGVIFDELDLTTGVIFSKI